MTIEIAPKATASAKPAEGSSGQKSTDKPEGGSANSATSFLAALACAQEVAPVAIDAAIAPPVDAAADSLVPTDLILLQEKPLDGASATLPDPALLLAQVAAVPVTVVPLPAEVARGKSGSAAGRDGALPLQAAQDSALGKPLNTPQAKSGKVVLDAAAQAAQPELADASTANTSAAATAAASKEATPERIHKFVQELTASLTKAPEGSTLALGSSRERSPELQVNPRVTSNEVSAQNWAAPQGAGGAMGVDGVVAGPATAGADGQYAEQVSYWISQDVQKAEMTLDGLGANPVEVSISMQGKEATVVFRSDEALTREALANASSQLQDAMSRQGVVLSGVSVGTSNSGDSQRQGSGGKPSGWKVGTVEAAAESAPSVSRTGTSGRSIDLFV
ncbi:flagellar hook-length control protein FliK [Rhodoferax mekongensis]|uniref:flagellar hook-length control protein FliK n=1 Tax=Rhodoferax mekongensis TaxID=3068341 RepID=UPI0028BD45DF|nr:flagellar hook-length control protein FliK [Rhodoferax sp. TBRC 17199]MDT7514295.1 flagellar hook-length control protein FliK [Rhodoferax sp. TBRC 17199]